MEIIKRPEKSLISNKTACLCLCKYRVGIIIKYVPERTKPKLVNDHSKTENFDDCCNKGSEKQGDVGYGSKEKEIKTDFK